MTDKSNLPQKRDLMRPVRRVDAYIRKWAHKLARCLPRAAEESRSEALATIFKRIIFPPLPVVALAVPVIALMMAWVFLLGNEKSPLAYVFYVASAYLFVVVCVFVVRRFPREGVRSLARRSTMASRALDDVEYRRRLFVALGLAIDVIWAVVNIVEGIALASIWLITLGAYYMILSAMRGVLFSYMRGPSDAITCKKAASIERLCGVMLLLATFVLSGIVCLVMKGDGGFSYEGVLIYAVATFAFYSLIVSIVNYVRLRGHDNVLVVLNCRINLAVALVSIFALEVAMLTEFSTVADAEVQYVMPIITGAAIAVALIAMGVRSIVSARTRMRD